MGSASRAKGLRGEAEVAAVFRAAGFAVRGLEGEGDWLCIPQTVNSPTLHVECKRQERVRVPAWIRQAEAEAPAGTVPVVCFRQNRGEWYATLALADFVGMIEG